MADRQHLGEAGVHLELGREETHDEGKKEKDDEYRQTQAEYEIFQTVQNNLPLGRAVFLRRPHRSAQDIADFPLFFFGDHTLFGGFGGGLYSDRYLKRNDCTPASRQFGRNIPLQPVSSKHRAHRPHYLSRRSRLAQS
jgi:hypothetical protein